MKIIVACNVFSLGGIKSAIRLPLKKNCSNEGSHTERFVRLYEILVPLVIAGANLSCTVQDA